MSPILFVALAAFVGVAALVGGVALMMRDKPASRVEDRLNMLAGLNLPGSAKENLQKSVLAQPLDDQPTLIEKLVARIGNFEHIFEQADTTLTISRFVIISAAAALGGLVVGGVLRVHFSLLPLLAILMGMVPTAWLLFRRKRRLKAFAVQLPDALDLLSRALRAGQSLGAGFSMVSSEMGPPLGREFQRVFEEQNLGIPTEQSLRDLAERVPNLDLSFFATAVILQRQTGGDLAEILDKIGHLIRERFQIWGQVQALTGEGRLSGIVLMALPVALFFAVYYMNPEYVMTLFTDPMGKVMLAVAVVLQIIGALVIRKIVNIRV